MDYIDYWFDTFVNEMNESNATCEVFNNETNALEKYIEVPGFGETDLTVQSEYDGSVGYTYICIDGSKEVCGKTREISRKYTVDTHKYDRWDYNVSDGILKITLYVRAESIPTFKCVKE